MRNLMEQVMKGREEKPFETLIWRGITIHIRSEAGCFTMRDLCHFDIEAVSPERAKLPITETGYRSHFFYGELPEDVVGAVGSWLDEEAESAEWKLHEASARQLSLL